MTGRAHLEAVFGSQTGWVFIGVGTGQYVADTGKVRHEHWAEHPHRWPAQADEIVDQIIRASEAGADVYFTPSLSENPVREKPKNEKHGRKPRPVEALWADLDDDYNRVRLSQLRARGGCWLVASGSGPDRWHLYVPLVEPAAPDVAADLLRRLAAYLGADPAPAWHGAYLRPVGTKNWKPAVLTGEVPGDVRFEDGPCGPAWSVDDLDDLLPPVEHTTAGSDAPDAEPVDDLPGWLEEIIGEPVTVGMDRSKRTMAAVGACVRAELSDGQVITAMRGHAPTVEKYDGRADVEVTRVLAKARAELDSNGSTPAPVKRVTLEQCIATYQKWLHLPDPGIVVATLGAAAANLIPGDPLWLLIVGPPSSAKTECVSALTPLPYVHPAAKVTEASLLSGTPPKEHVKAAKGGLLRQIGDFGIMLVKDFTSVLAQNRDTRAEALAALREVFDGRWDRPVGTGGGIVLSWSGKCGLIGGCTPTIDRHHAVMGTLGERFLFYRVTVDDPDDQASRRLGSRRHETDMRRELAAAIAGVLAGVDTDADIATDPDEDRWLVSLAVWTAARARTPVERDGYSREVVVMPESEGPARIVTQLGALRDGLKAIGAPIEERWAILHKLAWDAMPAMRREVLQALQRADGWAKRAELMDATDIPRAPIERELEDLVLIGLADREKAGDADNDPWQYRLSTEAHRLWPEAAPKRTTPPSEVTSQPSSKEMSTGSSTSRGSTPAAVSDLVAALGNLNRELGQLEWVEGDDELDEAFDAAGASPNLGELPTVDRNDGTWF